MTKVSRAELIVQKVEAVVWDYLSKVRGKHLNLMPALESEVRQIVGQMGGRPTSVTGLALARLEAKGLIKITKMGSDAALEVLK